MITLCIMPNLKCTRKQAFFVLLICLALDMAYIVPLMDCYVIKGK